MKKFYFITLMIMLGGEILRTQTNAADAPKPARAPTIINSDRADFDIAARKAFYYGNVRVDDPQMKLTCAQMVADLPQTGGHINRIVAETNVVIDSVDEKGQTNHATSDKAVYIYNVQNGVTNETVTLTGHAKVENEQGWLTGEPIVWDRANNSLHAENQKMLFRQNISDVMTNTNSAAGKTNKPAASKIF
ncbi:MAG TPA: LptA/OstA family protein [Verrucomicrobiae bacterium]|nr:LptA/OstA family protein [Verrucomicrobiae bacterium]